MKKLLTILACLMMAAIAFGQWEMVAGPEPDYTEPSAALALDATTIVSINDNVVMKTTDFGATWTEILLADDINLVDIGVAGDVLYASADDGIVMKSVDTGATWVNVKDTALAFDLDLNKISVVDANNVFVAGDDGFVLFTNDGGASWDTTNVGTGDDLTGGIAFSTALNGVAFSNGSGDAIYTTHDGGATWAATGGAWPVGLSTRQYDATALAPNVILVAGYHNVIWKTVDGGDNWTLVSEYTYAYDRLIEIAAMDENNVIALNSDSDIFTSSDAGTTWDTLAIGSAQSGKAMAFSSLSNGWVWTDNGQTYTTTDGSTFVPVNETASVTYYNIVNPSEGKLIATATFGGEVSMSNDGGATWSYPTNAETEAKGSLYGALAVDANTILIGGSSGYIGKSVDAGATWTVIDNPMAHESNKTIYFMYKAPSGDLYAGGSSAWLLKSSDDGDTWTQVEVNSSMTIYAMTVFSNGKAFLGGNSGKWCMSTSTVLDTFEQVTDMGSMSIRGAKERNGVILVAANDDVYKMTDTYDSLYSVLDIPSGNDAYDLEWVSDDVAFVVGSKGIIYRTDDAGENWVKEESGFSDYLYNLIYDGEKLWTVGKYGVIMSRKYEAPKADYTEEFTDGTADLTWVENTAAANTGGLNLTVAADSAGLTNVGIYVDDANTGLLYADTGKKLKNYEVSADIYCVKPASATEPLYKGIAVKVDPVDMAYYRFVYRNSSTSSGALKFQGFDGASWYGTTQWNAGEDFDTLETGFHNLKAQVVDNKFWLYIDGQLLPGCPISQEDDPVLEAGYPGLYVYGGNVEFDNFKVNVLAYPMYNITANVDMGIMVRRGEFDPASSALDIIGTFDGWSGTAMTDVDADTVYTASLGGVEAGTTIEFKCRRNGAWDNTEEFPSGGANRTYLVTDTGDQVIPTFLYSDITEVAIEGVPMEYALAQNYPNPFNPSTTIKFQIPNADMVTMNIFDLNGRKVAELFNTQMEAGFYNVTFDASSLPSGMYIYRLTAGNFSDVKKMTLLK